MQRFAVITVLFLCGVLFAGRFSTSCFYILQSLLVDHETGTKSGRTKEELNQVIQARTAQEDLRSVIEYVKKQKVDAARKAILLLDLFGMMQEKPYHFFYRSFYSSFGYFVFVGGPDQALVLRVSDSAIFKGPAFKLDDDELSQQIPSFIERGVYTQR